MTDQQFINMEDCLKGAIEDFKNACEEQGMDFEERIGDIVFDIQDDE